MQPKNKNMKTKDNRGLGGRLAELMRVYGLTTNALASEVGGTTAKYYKLIGNKSKPDFETIYAILDRFPEISAEWLMRAEGPMYKQDLLSKEEADSILAENRAVKAMYKAELLGKAKGVTNHLRDEEGASELLEKVRKGNVRNNNRTLLNQTWRFTNPN